MELQRPLRLWPAWIISLAMMVAIVLSVTPAIANQPRFFLMAGAPLLAGLLMSVWLLAGSRLNWREKVVLAVAAIVFPAISYLLVYPTEATQSVLFVYGVPLTVLAVTIGLTLGAQSPRRALLAVGLMAASWAFFPLIRNDGFDGEYYPEFAWRWSPVHEQSLPALSSPSTADFALDTNPAWARGASWTIFRGPNGNGTVDDQFAEIDWQATPPNEIWRIDVGPGWSSFSYHQGRLFTQEQRGELEYITCYRADDGHLIWSHGDKTRFEEVVSGAGPRGTPTVSDGRVFAFGARALLTCLDEQTGAMHWQRNLVKEVNATVPIWAFSGSPLVVEDRVIVYAGGSGNNGLIAVNQSDGQTIWGFPSSGENYSTPRMMDLCGESCLVFCDSQGVHGLNGASGESLWTYQPAGWKSAPYIDAQRIDEDRLLVALGDGVGMACLRLERSDDSWNISEQWSTNQLRPSFNDSLVMGDLIFGFNQSIFSCIDAQTGKRLWNGGRFGFGQAVLLKNSGIILLAAEKGDLVILRANGDKLDVLHRQPVLNDKTWNHPIVVGDRLFMRNAKTAVCLQLIPADEEISGEQAASTASFSSKPRLGVN